jgi:hypothetical protein
MVSKLGFSPGEAAKGNFSDSFFLAKIDARSLNAIGMSNLGNLYTAGDVRLFLRLLIK